MHSLKELKVLYDKGINISAFLRDNSNINHNTPEIIEASYDLQAGTYYYDMMNSPLIREKKITRSREIAKYIVDLCPSMDSFLKAGVGEASTLVGMMSEFTEGTQVFGFDISWSRTAYAQKLIDDIYVGKKKVHLCTGELEHIPFSDSSVSVVHTSHALEPNGGREKFILKELHRVCSDYLILIEPSFEFANDEQKSRMIRNGYCTNLISHINELGFDLIDQKLLENSINANNPSMMLTIKKSTPNKSNAVFACPTSHDPLIDFEQFLYCKESMLAYPVLSGIPCLRNSNSIVASKFMEFFAK